MPTPTAERRTDAKRPRIGPGPALAISLIALFVALGGTSYAAMTLPTNSVGTNQIKKNAVTSSKIKNKAVTASKIDTAGLLVPEAAHATNATNLGHRSASAFAAAVLPSGQSESGEWWLDQGSSGGWVGQGITYPTPLAGPLGAAQVEYVGNSTDSHCAGVGHAAPGYLCVYLPYDLVLAHPVPIYIDDTEGLKGSDAYGFILSLRVPSGNLGSEFGSWTVTAP